MKSEEIKCASMEHASFFNLKVLAFLGASEDQFNLAKWYELREPDKAKNRKLAYKLMKKAAEKGYIPALFDLGLYYQKGFGTDQDYQAMRSCWESVANHKAMGYEDYQRFLLAKRYSPRNFLRLINQGYSLRRIGTMFSYIKFYPIWVRVRLDPARLYIARSMLRLAYEYYQGNVFEKDIEKARGWLEKKDILRCRRTEVEASYLLAEIYREVGGEELISEMNRCYRLVKKQFEDVPANQIEFYEPVILDNELATAEGKEKIFLNSLKTEQGYPFVIFDDRGPIFEKAHGITPYPKADDVFSKQQPWLEKYFFPLVSIDLGELYKPWSGVILHFISHIDDTVDECRFEAGLFSSYSSDYSNMHWHCFRLTDSNRYEFSESEHVFPMADVNIAEMKQLGAYEKYVTKRDKEKDLYYKEQLSYNQTGRRISTNREEGEVVLPIINSLGGSISIDNWTEQEPSAFKFGNVFDDIIDDFGDAEETDGIDPKIIDSVQMLSKKGNYFYHIGFIDGHSWPGRGTDEIHLLYEPVERLVLLNQ